MPRGRDCDVGANEMMALAQLFTVGPCSPTELAAFLSMTTASVTSLLDRLQRAGHVVRRQHPSDRRRVVVELTPRARDTLAAMFHSPVRPRRTRHAR